MNTINEYLLWFFFIWTIKYIIMVNINGYFYDCVSTWNTIKYEIWSLWIDINEYLLLFFYMKLLNIKLW